MDTLIYHWSHIMDTYKDVFIRMDPADLGELIQKLLTTKTIEELKNNSVDNKAVSYFLTLLSQDICMGHTIKM